MAKYGAGAVAGRGADQNLASASSWIVEMEAIDK